MIFQRGFATLTVITGVLSISLLLALSVGTLGWTQIKRNQNFIHEIQDSLTAKAGLDCAIAIYEQENLNVKTDFAATKAQLQRCQNYIFGVDINLAPHASVPAWSLTARSGFVTYSALIAEQSQFPSAFKTAGNLHLKGGNDWVPAKGRFVKKDGDISLYECVAIYSGGDVIIDTDTGSSVSPFQSQLKGQKERCVTGFSTTISSGKKMINDQLLDDSSNKDNSERYQGDIFYQQPGMDLFKEYFGVKKSEWESVRDQFSATLDTSGKTGDVSNVSLCAEHINQLRDQQVNKLLAIDSPRDDLSKRQDTLDVTSALNDELITIWIDGDCDLSGIESDPDHPVLLVFKDGAVGFRGSMAGFNGGIFQFAHDRLNESGEMDYLDSWLKTTSDPNGNPSYSCTTGAFSAQCAEYSHVDRFGLSDPSIWAKLPFVFHGSFESVGGYAVDIPGSISRVMGSFKPGYDEDIMNSITNRFAGPPFILKGSIHDH